MSWSKIVIFFAGILLCAFLGGGVHLWQAKEFYQDRIYLDEVFSAAAKDACEESYPELKPELVWTRFLTACEASLSGDVWQESVKTAFITTESGYYPYERETGWGSLVYWQQSGQPGQCSVFGQPGDMRAEPCPPDRLAQLSEWLPGCVFPQDELAQWENGFPANCLVVIYRENIPEDPEGMYLRAAVGGARCVRRKPFYVTETKGIRTYHREGCPLLPDKAEILAEKAVGEETGGANGRMAEIEKYYSMEECAKSGAWPCRNCMEESD